MLDEKDEIEVAVAAALEEDDVLAAEEDDDDDDVSGFNGVAETSIPATGLPMSLLLCSTIVILSITRYLKRCFVISSTTKRSGQVNAVLGFRSPF